MALENVTVIGNIMFGEAILSPVRYWIEEKETGKWLWKRVEYYVKCEFSSLGPFQTRKAAKEILDYMRGKQNG